jgi:hypothetical protein
MGIAFFSGKGNIGNGRASSKLSSASVHLMRFGFAGLRHPHRLTGVANHMPGHVRGENQAREETMGRYLVAAAGILACTGCAAAPPTEPVVSQVTTSVAPDYPDCRNYKATATIDGTERQIVGRACLQNDGSWRITEGPPAQPAEYGAVYEPPPYWVYPGYDPWFWGPPIGLSLGAFVFFDRDHHLHRFRGFPHFATRGLHRDFDREGFTGRERGFHGGFGGGGFGGMHRGRG